MGLAQNVVFDPWTRKKGVGPINETEGARLYPGGGSGWRVQRGDFGEGSYQVSKPLNGGGRVYFDVTKNPDGTLNSEVSFTGIGGYRGQGGNTRSAIKRFSEVMDAVQQFTSRVKPNNLNWSAANEGLERFYNRVAPEMVEKLGGYPNYMGGGSYSIGFPQASVYPLMEGNAPPSLGAPRRQPGW